MSLAKETVKQSRLDLQLKLPIPQQIRRKHKLISLLRMLFFIWINETSLIKATVPTVEAQTVKKMSTLNGAKICIIGTSLLSLSPGHPKGSVLKADTFVNVN